MVTKFKFTKRAFLKLGVACFFSASVSLGVAANDKPEAKSNNVIPADYHTIMKLLDMYDPPVHSGESVIRIPELMKGISDRKIVMVGEVHDQFEQHLAQLAILQTMHQKSPDLGIGIEWIQAQYQPDLTAYMEGEIDLFTFLERTQYQKNWGYDIRMLLPIFEYAKRNNIAMYAIDVDKPIVNKIYHQGIDSLTEEERSRIPKEDDLVELNIDQQKELESIMRVHDVSQEKIDNLVLAQRIRDAGMVNNVLNAMQYGKHSKMIVLAGINHVLNDRGMSHVFANKVGVSQFVNISVQTEEQMKNRNATAYIVQSPILYLPKI